MVRPTLYVVAGIVLASVWWLARPAWQAGSHETVFQPNVRFLEPAPMCPWRAPEEDLHHFFPTATGHETETRILSGKRLELQQRLGRTPQPDEQSLYVHLVRGDDRCIGSILTRRVKGEYGAIEIVLAVNHDGTVRGLRFQRLREPDAVAQALEDPAWLKRFAGQSADSEWRLGHAVADLPEAARPSGQAVVEAVRSLLVLLSTAEEGADPGRHH